MTYKEKIITLFKTILEIKEDLEELRFGTYVLVSNHKTRIIGENSNLTYLVGYTYNGRVISQRYSKERLFNLGNELEERHLRIYCREKLIVYTFTNSVLSHILMLKKGEEIYNIILDSTKSFDNQSEEFWEKLYNFLNK